MDTSACAIPGLTRRLQSLLLGEQTANSPSSNRRFQGPRTSLILQPFSHCTKLEPYRDSVKKSLDWQAQSLGITL